MMNFEMPEALTIVALDIDGENDDDAQKSKKAKKVNDVALKLKILISIGPFLEKQI